MKIKEVCLYSSDIESAREFYEQVMGFQFFGEVKGRHVFFRVGDLMLLIFNPELTKNDSMLPSHFAVGSQHIAFEVSIDEYVIRMLKLKELGISILHEQTWKNGGKSFYFHDPAGNLLEIVQPGIWGF